jgi:hypothetical protein
LRLPPTIRSGLMTRLMKSTYSDSTRKIASFCVVPPSPSPHGPISLIF